MSQSSFACTQLNSFKYCYSTKIILFCIRHLFANILDGFKCFYLSAIDPQPLPSNTFKMEWVFFFH